MYSAMTWLSLVRRGNFVTSVLCAQEQVVDTDKGWCTAIALRQSNVTPPWTHVPRLQLVSATPRTTRAFDTSWTPLRDHYPVSLLKSTLQKAVRRQQPRAAVELALQLLRQDATQMLRRWIVIVMEDAVLDVDVAWATWWMVALSKGWQMSEDDVVHLLRMVYRVAASPYHEVIPEKNALCANPLQHTRFDLKNTTPLRSACLALLVRCHYGGMPGDMLFLRGFVARWWQRTATWTQWLPYVAPQNVTYPDWLATPQHFSLTPASKLAQGVDFHCWPQMLHQIQDAAPALRVKKAIWYHRSGVYTKQYVCPRQHVRVPEPVKNDRTQDTDDVKQLRLTTYPIWLRIRQRIETLSTRYWQRAKRKAPRTILSFFTRDETQKM